MNLGATHKLSGTLDADFGFTGHYYHAPSELDLTLYRAYSAGFGKMAIQRPIGPNQAFNCYTASNLT